MGEPLPRPNVSVGALVEYRAEDFSVLLSVGLQGGVNCNNNHLLRPLILPNATLPVGVLGGHPSNVGVGELRALRRAPPSVGGTALTEFAHGSEEAAATTAIRGVRFPSKSGTCQRGRAACHSIELTRRLHAVAAGGSELSASSTG